MAPTYDHGWVELFERALLCAGANGMAAGRLPEERRAESRPEEKQM